MTADKRLIHDSADDFYGQLEALLTADWSIRKKYAYLRDIFCRIVNQGVDDAPLNFSGLFAKLDYLLKERSVPTDVSAAVNDTRKMLNDVRTTDDTDLTDRLPDNVKATALLASYVCGRLPLPASLDALLPSKPRRSTWGKFDATSLRCIVDSWDDDHIYVTEERNGSSMTVCYGPGNTILSRDGIGDWSYLREIIDEGSQLNLVRPRFDGDICMPELIIYEPDILINVTTVASCFETYAESPVVALINKLKQQPNTPAIHLGNLCSQYLDDTVHNRKPKFDEEFVDFFRKNALSLAACDDLLDNNKLAKLRREAQEQQQNVRKLIGHDLPATVEGFNMSEVVLEPTFFSDVLGLQGRFDFLYDSGGKTVIIEQKSGKGGFPCYDPTCPPPQEKHVVQLLLYRALYVYEFNKHAADLRHVMLLYSKYTQGLVAVGQNQDLLLRAIKMRNMLAWCEMRYAHKGFDRLAELTPETVNEKGSRGKLWNDYTYPDLDALLSPIQKASPLERAYFLRFMQFVAKEHLLAKLGNKTKANSGFASIWLDTLDDKLAAGSIYERLSIVKLEGGGQSVDTVTLAFDGEKSADTSNFRKGDIVMLYPYHRDSQPNACAQMVVRATIADITSACVTLSLRNPQADKRIFDVRGDDFWAVEHDMFDSAVTSQYAGLHRFLTASQPHRDLLLSQRAPVVDTSFSRRGEYGSFNTLVERSRQARELFIVIGPPGTGKTSFGLMNILKEELLDEGSATLLLSYTNRAVDEICGKLKESGIDFLRLSSKLSCDPTYHDNLLQHRLQQCNTRAEIATTIKSARVVCATTAALNGNTALFSIKRFDLAIVDEASQILEPQLVGLLCARSGDRDAIGRVVLIGDHKQLPAVVLQSERESRVDEGELIAAGITDCRRSLFERMLSRFKTDDGYDSRYVYMLKRQGRMHSEIAAFPNYAFYAGRLDVVPLDHQKAPCHPVDSRNGIDRLLSSRRVAFVASENPGLLAAEKTNAIEARMIAAVVRRVYELNRNTFDAAQTVGVIVPYRNQIATVRNAIDRYNIATLHDITIDTVERYQGSQRDYIIYGFTVQQRSQLNFLTDGVFEEDGMVIDRKLNVAMTRARLHLMLIGNPELLAFNRTFAQLIEFMKRRNSYFSIPTNDFVNGNFNIGTTIHQNDIYDTQSNPGTDTDGIGGNSLCQ